MAKLVFNNDLFHFETENEKSASYAMKNIIFEDIKKASSDDESKFKQNLEFLLRNYSKIEEKNNNVSIIIDYQLLSKKINIVIPLIKKDPIKELKEQIATLTKRVADLEKKLRMQRPIVDESNTDEDYVNVDDKESQSSTIQEDLTKYGEKITDFTFPWQQFHEWLMNPPAKVLEVYKKTIDEYKSSCVSYNQLATKKFFYSADVNDASNIDYHVLYEHKDETKWALVVTFLSTIGVRVKYYNYTYGEHTFHKTQTKVMYHIKDKIETAGMIKLLINNTGCFRFGELLE